MTARVVCLLSMLVMSATTRTLAECNNQRSRALVLSGGSTKGAFQAGAIYHLVVHRGCDFVDFAGVSVGALNAAYLAQADSKQESLSHLRESAVSLVKLWRGITSTDQLGKKRLFGKLGVFVFGAESVYEFTPLKVMIRATTDVDRLHRSGRDVRVGVTNIYDGTYHEMTPESPGADSRFLDFVFASAAQPVYFRLPGIPPPGSDDPDEDHWPQFADGGVRHTTPLPGYFPPATFLPVPLGAGPPIAPRIGGLGGPGVAVPAHRGLQEVFVISASPYSAYDDSVEAPECCRGATQQRRVTSGSEMLGRALSLVIESPYRWDLNYARVATEMLRWREQVYKATSVAVDLRAHLDRTFPVGSYNRRDGMAVAYDRYGVITPVMDYTHGFEIDAASVGEQLRCGCLAANAMMRDEFAEVDLGTACWAEFPEPAEYLDCRPVH